MTFNKFHAKKVTINGMTFDSLAEARRWRDLSWLERGGVIKGLSRQVKYTLIPNQYDEDGKLIERSVTYIADFVYQEDGKLVVEDVKGVKTPEYIIKRKLMLKVYGIRIREVR